MLRLMKYLKKSAGYIVLIVALLFLQAYCDLSLPDYTSKIVNVGIQQQGIEDGVPEKMRAATMESLSAFTDEEGREKIADSYTQEEELYVLKDDITKEDREELNDVICQAIMLLSQHASQTGQGMEGGAQLSSQLSQMPDSMVEQAAAAFVRAEYEAIGEDVDRIQMHYILESGLEMLLMALLIMAASISVTFLSSRVAAALGHDLRNGVYRKVMGFSSSEYNKFSTASLITRSTNDVQQVQLTMAMMFRIVLYAPILGIGGVIRVLQTDSSMTWILGLGVALILAVILMLFLIAMPKFTKLQTLIDRLNLVTREILTGIPVIRAFSREKHEE